MWACGAAGSALPWHGRGRRFDPDQVHQKSKMPWKTRSAQRFCDRHPRLARAWKRSSRPAGSRPGPPIPQNLHLFLLGETVMWLRKGCFLLAIAIAAVAADNPLQVPIKEFDVPTANARPHDPAVSPDGALWT